MVQQILKQREFLGVGKRRERAARARAESESRAAETDIYASLIYSAAIYRFLLATAVHVPVLERV